MPLLWINCINTIATSVYTTPYLGACIAQFEGLALLVEITCRRSYFCLASLDARIISGKLFLSPLSKLPSAQFISGRSFFNPFSKLPSAQFCSNVVCLHGDVFFLPSSLLPSLVWLESSTSHISQSDPSSPFLIR